MKRDLVAEAGEPEGVAVLVDAGDVVLVDGDADALQHAAAEHGALAGALGLEVVPPVVIAEHGMHAERRLELAQRLRPRPRRGTARVLNLWLAAKSPSSTMMSGFSSLVRRAMAAMRSAGMIGPPACTSAITPILRLRPRGQLAGEMR